MIRMCEELDAALSKGHVLTIDDVWRRYQDLCEETSTSVPSSYISWRTSFKEKLEVHTKKVYKCIVPLHGHPCERQTLLVLVNYAQASTAQIIQAQNEGDNDTDIPVPC